MPTNTLVFLFGLAFGTSLLAIGGVLGYWLGRKLHPAGDVVDRQQFLVFLKNLSNWTSQFSGDVTEYQSKLTRLSEQAEDRGGLTQEGLQSVLSEIMSANNRLQERLESAEARLEQQTDQISSYLSEARTDGLTGLFNRRALDKAMDGLFDDWKRQSQVFSLGLIDIDHFKKFNDTYGHQAGDVVLQRVSSILQMELQDSVCVARYGGEEFAVLTTDSAEQMAAALDVVRLAVSRVEVEYEEHRLSVTISAGASEIGLDDMVGNLVRRADEALYASKLAGRNRVHLHDRTLCLLVTKAGAIAAASPSEIDAPTPAQSRVDENTQTRAQQRLSRIVEEESRRLASRQ